MRKRKIIRKGVKKMAAMTLMAGVLVTSGLSGVNAYAQSYDWYLYYNDSHTNFTTNSWSFPKYAVHTYTATPGTRGGTGVTLIQPGTGTTFKKNPQSYAVGDAPVSVVQQNATGNSSWLVTKLSYNTYPASTSGTLSD